MNTKLEQFQENVKRLSEIARSMAERSDECVLGAPVLYRVDGGSARVWVLFEDDDVSIVKAVLSPLATFPLHQHDAAEIIVVYHGSATYSSNNVARELGAGDCVRVPAGKAHRVTAGAEGARFSVTTVPREAAFSSAGGWHE